MSFRKGSKVWLEDKELAWVEGEVVDLKDNLFVVLTNQRKKVL
jgi:myosin V